MNPIASRIDPESEEAKANAEYHRGLATELSERLTAARQGGGDKYRKRHRERG